MSRTLLFDTETTGFVNEGAPLMSQPYMVQIAAQLIDDASGRPFAHFSAVTIPEFKGQRVRIPEAASKVHGITDEHVDTFGMPYKLAAPIFANMCRRADRVVAHNANFDKYVLLAAFARCAFDQSAVRALPLVCTMHTLGPVLNLPKKHPRQLGTYGWPSLQKAHEWAHPDGIGFEDAHDAMVDVEAMALAWRKIVADGVALHECQWPEG